MIKGIIFDFGGVICNFDNSIFLNKWAKCSPKSVEDIREILYHKSDVETLAETGLISSDEFIRKTIKLCELNISKDDFIKSFVNIFTTINPTMKLIKKLMKKYILGLLSNTTELHFNHKIKNIEVFDLFNAVTTSFKVKAMKPDPKIYRDSLSKLKLRASQCVFIDDLQENVDGAAKLGIHGIHYTSPEKLEKSLKGLGIKY